MCGIAGIVNTNKKHDAQTLKHYLTVMGHLIAHRGPDADGVWIHENSTAACIHKRLSIIDVSEAANQPMQSVYGSVIVFNGELYNYLELKANLSEHWQFKTHSDTEVILAAYHQYGVDCIQHFKGMFAFVIFDGDRVFCARDHFGIKPFYYTEQNDVLYFASETKALVPFLPNIQTDRAAFVEYVTFQYPMGSHTLFEHIFQLEAAHAMLITPQGRTIWRYWDVHFHIDYDHSADYFESRLKALMDESMSLHLRSDVGVGAYVSGGVDSSLISLLASQHQSHQLFHGRFLESEAYDESRYAEAVAQASSEPLSILDIQMDDFLNHIQRIIYHLDFPVAGPGVFPQYMVSGLAAQNVKVVLGGQGGDEIFGGYARYVIAYFEQCIKAAIEGNYKKGRFVVTAESIIPNLEVLKQYKPLLKRFWQSGLFESLDKRYFALVNRAQDASNEVFLTASEQEVVFQKFLKVFHHAKSEHAESYFDSMTHFDFKCLLPGLLHVEDRVSMAHGLEARVPFLYHPLIEFVATIPADIKFKDGQMKHLLKKSFKNILPPAIVNRKDKMGFPVPMSEWMNNPNFKQFIHETFEQATKRNERFVNYQAVLKDFETSAHFSRKLWGFLCYELWQQQFHDQVTRYHDMLKPHHLCETV